MKIGYARVSRQEQELDRQIEALKRDGCEVIYQEKITGSLKNRPELDRMLSVLNVGDVVVVQKLDRLGRSLRHLFTLMDMFKDIGVEFKSLNESIDTSTSIGRLLFSVLGAVAEFERDLIRERTKDGLASKKARGIKLGRRFKDFRVEIAAFEAVADQERQAVMNTLSISKSKYFRLKRMFKNLKIEAN